MHSSGQERELVRLQTKLGNEVIVTPTRILWYDQGGGITQIFIRDVTDIRSETKKEGWRDRSYILYVYVSFRRPEWTTFATEAERDQMAFAMRSAMEGFGT